MNIWYRILYFPVLKVAWDVLYPRLGPPKWVISAPVAPKVGFTLRTFTWSPALWDLWATLFTVQQEATTTASLHTVKHLLHFLSGSL